MMKKCKQKSERIPLSSSPSLVLLFFPILMIIGEQEEGRDQSVSTIDLEMSRKGGAVTAAGNPIRLYSLPNVITALNLVCGNLAIVSAVEDHLTLTAYWILAAAIFDFLDGFVARWLQKYSEIGLQLDSLADMSSFGIATAIFTYEHVFGGFFFVSTISLFISLFTIHRWKLMRRALLMNPVVFPRVVSSLGIDAQLTLLIEYSPLLISIFSAFRLAKFNIDARQSDTFIGLPTPANAIFFTSLINAPIQAIPAMESFSSSPMMLLGLVLVFSALLISEISMFSMK